MHDETTALEYRQQAAEFLLIHDPESLLPDHVSPPSLTYNIKGLH
jgi:hypothetical protein